MIGQKGRNRDTEENRKKEVKKLMNQKPGKKAGKTNADSSEIQHLCVFLSMYTCKDREDTKQWKSLHND